MWSVKFEVWSAKSAVWSVECEDFASSLAEKTACRGKDTVRTGFSSNYRSFIFGKLPPPACPGLCYSGLEAPDPPVALYNTVDGKLRILLWHCIIQWAGRSGFSGRESSESSSGTV